MSTAVKMQDNASLSSSSVVNGIDTDAVHTLIESVEVNPPQGIARSLSDTFAGIRPADAPGFLRVADGDLGLPCAPRAGDGLRGRRVRYGRIGERG